MGYIREKLTIKGNKGSTEVDAFFDSGSKRTFILKEKAEPICDIQYYDEPRLITLADGQTTVNNIGFCTFETNIDDKPIDDSMDVLDVPKTEKNADMYIGVQRCRNLISNYILATKKAATISIHPNMILLRIYFNLKPL